MNAIVKNHSEEIADLCRRYGVRRQELSGSAALASQETAPRDIDFLVFYPDGYDAGPWMSRVFALERGLSESPSYLVDLVMDKALESRWFRSEAAQTRKVIDDASQIADVA